MVRPGAFALAVFLDLAAGEPQLGHPVRAMGRFLEAAGARRRSRDPRTATIEGGAVVCAGAALSGVLAWLVAGRLRRLPPPLSTLGSAILLKPTFSIRALLRAGARTRRALEAGELVRARTLLGRDLVSRPTRRLSGSQVASAAIESLAENLTDSVCAPLLAAALGGPGAAYCYRFINTADAVLGYRSSELLHYGRFAARFDDMVNWLPARLAALLISLSAPAGGGARGRALAAARRGAELTASPNAGCTMGAMAGALGVRLSKPGTYTLEPEAPEPTSLHIERAERIVRRAAIQAAAIAVTVAVTLAGQR